MSLQEQVYSVLIVSAADAFNTSLQALLPDSKFSPVRIENNISSAKRILTERTFDFVVINSPLPDDAGIRFAIDLCAAQTTVVLLMVRAELYTVTYDKAAQHGVYLLPKPTAKQTVIQALDWMVTTCERLKKFEKKTMSIEDKMQEIRTVNRAKWLLIDQLQMTEGDAHRYIEKQAMDRCVSKTEIAETIIKTYS